MPLKESGIITQLIAAMFALLTMMGVGLGGWALLEITEQGKQIETIGIKLDNILLDKYAEQNERLDKLEKNMVYMWRRTGANCRGLNEVRELEDIELEEIELPAPER